MTVDTVAITERDFEALRQRLQRASAEVRARSQRRMAAIELAQRERRPKDLLDLLVVGGVTLADMVANPALVPEEVERAFALAYPGLAAQGEGLADAGEDDGLADRLRHAARRRTGDGVAVFSHVPLCT